MIDNLTVCIKTFARPRQCEQAIKSVRKYLGQVPIVVVDDDLPSKKVSKQVTTTDDAITFINTDYDIGVSAGRNMAVAAAQTDFVLCIDDNARLGPRTRVKEAVAILTDRPQDADIICSRRKGKGLPSMLVQSGGGLKIVDGNTGEIAPDVFACELGDQHIVSRRDTLVSHPWPGVLRAFEHWPFFVMAKQAGLKIAVDTKSFYTQRKAGTKPSRADEYHRRNEYKRLAMEMFGYSFVVWK